MFRSLSFRLPLSLFPFHTVFTFPALASSLLTFHSAWRRGLSRLCRSFSERFTRTDLSISLHTSWPFSLSIKSSTLSGSEHLLASDSRKNQDCKSRTVLEIRIKTIAFFACEQDLHNFLSKLIVFLKLKMIEKFICKTRVYVSL